MTFSGTKILAQKSEFAASVDQSEALASSSRSAASGMAWTSIAVVFSKFLSFFSQIILGYTLAIDSYAVFGISATALSLVAGFQNSGISKALIQKQGQFVELFPTYSAFALYFGVLGSAILIVIGLIFEQIYHVNNLFWVVSITSLTVVIVPVNAVQMAALSVKYRFREINMVEMQRAVLYYLVLIGAALVGAEYFTMAVAGVVGALFHFVLLKSKTPDSPISFKLSFRQFTEIAWNLRLIIFAGLLTALAMRSDILILSKLISIETLGFYTFGFMLVTSVTIPLSAGINQVFLPVFSRLQSNQALLRKEIPRFSAVVVAVGTAMSLLLVGLSSPLINVLWDGKWDPAGIVVTAIAMAMPFRFLSTIAAAGIESYGRWGVRIGLLTFEMVLLLVSAAIGAYFYGLVGAAVGAALQRALSGFAGYYVLSRIISTDTFGLLAFLIRLYVPYAVSVTLLLALNPTRLWGGEISIPLGRACLDTLLSLLIFSIVTLAVNHSVFSSALKILSSRYKREQDE